MIQVGIIEDDKIVREGLATYLESQHGFACTVVADSVEQFFEEWEKQNDKLQVILSDIGLPGKSGIEGIRLIKEKIPDTEVIMLTVYNDEDRIFKSICAGATGYLLKTTPLHEIKSAIHSLLEGGSPMSPTIARKVITYFNPTKKKKEKAESLTPREMQIVQGLVDGLSYKQIAYRLSIAESTVQHHIKHIYKKLQVNSKGEVIAKSLKGEIE